MTWRLLTLFNLLVFLSPAASVSGEVTVFKSGHAKAKYSDSSGVVVSLVPLTTNDTSAIPVSATQFEMRQHNKAFVPHILAIPMGSTVNFPNLDPIFHNAFSNYDGQIFDIGLYPPGSSRKVRFRKAGVVRVFCNIHSAMSAVIVVLDTHFYTVAQNGLFSIDKVPPGSYRLNFYAEQATEQSLEDLSRIVTVADSTVDLGATRLVESDYLTIPHLNKYGKPYTIQPDPGAYPGARQ